MRLVYSTEYDVYNHLAAESYFLHEFEGDVLMIWRSKDAVVCGKHQNACGEANYKFCDQNNIRIARRLSGGGTVFHDMGNVNFTFIKRLTEGMERAVDYKRYLEPVRAVLRSIGIETTYSKRDDLLLEGIKISGNAQHIYQKGLKGLHHGTLLYDADLHSLGNAIHSEGKYEGKSVPSNRSDVTNIRKWHDLGPTESFIEKLLVGFESFFGTSFGPLTSDELLRCHQISQEKFSQDSWILGYSPRYTHRRSLNWTLGNYALEMKVYQDAIEELRIQNDAGELCFKNSCEKMLGKPLRMGILERTFEGVSRSELLDLF